MNPTLLRTIGIVLALCALVTAILNLHRVADLKMPWLPALFIILFAAVMLVGRRRQT